MKKYEYKIVDTARDYTEEILNHYGEMGWRCIRIHHMPGQLRLYLEREIEVQEVDIRMIKDEE